MIVLVPILISLGLEQSLYVISIIDFIEEVKLALRGYPKSPPHLACSRVQCQLLFLVGFCHCCIELIVCNRPSERLCRGYRVPGCNEPCVMQNERITYLSGCLSFSSPSALSPSDKNFRSSEPSGVALSFLLVQVFCAPVCAITNSSADTGTRSIRGQPSAFQCAQFLSLESTVSTMR